MDIVFRIVFYLFCVVILGIFLARYIAKIFNGNKVFVSRFLSPIEKLIYRCLKLNPEEEMSASRYFYSVISISLVSFLFLFFILCMQGILPANKENVSSLSWDLAFHTAISYITNTNFQNYQGELQLSEFSQMIGLTVQNFISSAIGICILFALVRGFIQKEKQTIGNFWVDLTRVILYILIPLSLVVSILLISTGVVQTFEKNKLVTTLEGKQQLITLGPVASQIAIKQLGSNGGGYFGVNSAHPFENPTAFSNWIEMVSILLIPVSLVFFFGNILKKKKEGFSIFTTMLILFLISLFSIICLENTNWEGKESRFGILNSSIWATATTATSNGSVNAMLDSYAPLSGAVLLLNMGVGEIIFGGVGSGLYTMLGFILLAVFIAGLMIGRSPEYLGKKIESHDMKMILFITLTTPVCVLIFSSISMLNSNLIDSVSNSSPHGFSQVFYAFLSAGANNGSAFSGWNGNTIFLNGILGIVMLLARFVPIYGVLQLAQNLSHKQKIATTSGTLKTDSILFIVMSIVVILIIGALSFLPAIALGPIAEYFTL